METAVADEAADEAAEDAAGYVYTTDPDTMMAVGPMDPDATGAGDALRDSVPDAVTPTT